MWVWVYTSVGACEWVCACEGVREGVCVCVWVCGLIFPNSNELAKKTYGSPQHCNRLICDVFLL